MSDPLERYYSAPPPSGLRERLRQRKRSLLVAVVTVLAVGAAFGVARIAAGDGKGSGNVQRAFGGYISPEDEDRLASITSARNAAETSYLDITDAARAKDLDAIVRAAATGSRRVNTALAGARELENDQLRTELTALLERQRDVFVAYGRLATYARTHRGRASKAKLDELVTRTTQAEARSRAASATFYKRVSAYMRPEQRRQFEETRRAGSAP